MGVLVYPAGTRRVRTEKKIDCFSLMIKFVLLTADCVCLEKNKHESRAFEPIPLRQKTMLVAGVLATAPSTANVVFFCGLYPCNLRVLALSCVMTLKLLVTKGQTSLSRYWKPGELKVSSSSNTAGGGCGCRSKGAPRLPRHCRGQPVHVVYFGLFCI